MPKTPTVNLGSQTAQETAALESAVLARVYDLLLKWSRKARTESSQGKEKGSVKSQTDNEKPKVGQN